MATENKKIKSFRDLEIWKSGIELVRTVYEITKSFPSAENYGLTSQIKRSAVLVPSNIAEGHIPNIKEEKCRQRS